MSFHSIAVQIFFLRCSALPLSTRKTLENKIQSAFENKAEPLTSFSISVFSISAFTMNSFVHSGILDFTETDKVNYKAA